MSRPSPSAHDVALLTNVVEIARPDAPYDLSDEEANEWRAIVNRKAADAFPRETWPLLSAYCRITVEDRHLAEMIQAMKQSEKFNIDTYYKLVKLQQANAGVLSTLATKMRVAQQSAFEHSKKQPLMISPPWTNKDKKT